MTNKIILTGSLDIGDPQGLTLSIPGFRGNPTSIPEKPEQIHVEVYEGVLQVHVWTGDEDPTYTIKIEKEPTCGSCKSYMTEEEMGRNGKSKTIEKCFYGCPINKNSKICIEFEEN